MASVVFIIQGADRLLRPGGTGVFRKCGVSKLYPPPRKKELFFSYRWPVVYYVPGGTGFLESVKYQNFTPPPQKKNYYI